jgi:hypothetical protein
MNVTETLCYQNIRLSKYENIRKSEHLEIGDGVFVSELGLVPDWQALFVCVCVSEIGACSLSRWRMGCS